MYPCPDPRTPLSPSGLSPVVSSGPTSTPGHPPVCWPALPAPLSSQGYRQPCAPCSPFYAYSHRSRHAVHSHRSIAACDHPGSPRWIAPVRLAQLAGGNTMGTRSHHPAQGVEHGAQFVLALRRLLGHQCQIRYRENPLFIENIGRRQSAKRHPPTIPTTTQSS